MTDPFALTEQEKAALKEQERIFTCFGNRKTRECRKPVARVIVFHGRVWTYGCNECIAELGQYIIQQGHGSFLELSLSRLIQDEGLEKAHQHYVALKVAYGGKALEVRRGPYYNR